MDNLAHNFSNVSISNANNQWPLHKDGTYRLPDTVDDFSGDPNGVFYIPPPSVNDVGKRWVVWRGLRPGIYPSWSAAAGYVNGVSHAAHEGFGTPQIAWHAYETSRQQGFVQIVPYIPPGAPPIPPFPGPHNRGTPNRLQASNPPPANPQSPNRTSSSRGYVTAPSTPSRTQGRGLGNSSAIRSPRAQSKAASPAPRIAGSSSNQRTERPSPARSPRSSSISSPSSISSSSSYLEEPFAVTPFWERKSVAFVVFAGTAHGVYPTWQETYEMTRDCAGAVYRGYEHRRDAVHAYSAARQADLLRNI